jgi:hypothetical protein
VLSGAELGNEKDSVEVLAQALKTNTTVTVLDLSNNNLEAKGAKVVAELLDRYMYAWLLVFNFDSPYRNSILISHTTSATTLAIPPWTSPLISDIISSDITADITALPSPPTSPRYHHHRHHLRQITHHCRHHRGAMVKFDISSNDIRAEGGKALAAGLKGNQVITELNISSNNLGFISGYGNDTSGVIAIADVIPDMGALSKLIFGGEKYRYSYLTHSYELGSVDGKQQVITPESAILEVGMTEADLSNKNLGAGGAIIVAAWISHKDKGALTSLDISSNNLVGEKGTGRYKTVDAENSDDTDEEEQIMEPEFSGIIAIANAIPDMRALTSLNLAGNYIGGHPDGRGGCISTPEG